MRQISSIIFCQIEKIDAGILTYFKEILAKMTENLPKDGVPSRQAVAQRCCLKLYKMNLSVTGSEDHEEMACVVNYTISYVNG